MVDLFHILALIFALIIFAIVWAKLPALVASRREADRWADLHRETRQMLEE